MRTEDYPSAVIKVNFDDCRLLAVACLTDEEQETYYRRNIERCKLSGRIDAAGLNLTPDDLE